MERSLKNICGEHKTSLWKIRKILTEKSEGCLNFDNKDEVEKYVLPNLGVPIRRVLIDPIKIKIDDYDRGSQYDVILGYNHKSGHYYLGGLWRMKELAVGDEVGLFYDPIAKNLCFSVLKQAKP